MIEGPLEQRDAAEQQQPRKGGAAELILSRRQGGCEVCQSQHQGGANNGTDRPALARQKDSQCTCDQQCKKEIEVPPEQELTTGAIHIVMQLDAYATLDFPNLPALRIEQVVCQVLPDHSPGKTEVRQGDQKSRSKGHEDRFDGNTPVWPPLRRDQVAQRCQEHCGSCKKHG